MDFKEGFKGHPGIKWVGQEPFEVTNWDPSQMAKVISALIAKYPKIDGMFADLSGPILTSGAFPRANRPLPLVGGEDANVFGCTWEKMHKEDPKSTFQFTTSSAEQWNIRLAIEWAIASAAGGKVDQPLIITDTKGVKHTVANPGEKIVKNFVMDEFVEGRNLLPQGAARVGGQRNEPHNQADPRLVERRSLTFRTCV